MEHTFNSSVMNILKKTNTSNPPREKRSGIDVDEAGDSVSFIRGKLKRCFEIIVGLRKKMHQLKAESKRINEELDHLKNEQSQLKVQLKEKTTSLKRDSKTSSKPPSTDKSKASNKTKSNSRNSSGRKSGGQQGHQGSTLDFTSEPDKTVYLDFVCEYCKERQAGVEPQIEVTRETLRQVVELECKTVVTEMIGREGVCCTCGGSCKSKFPEGITQPVQYGTFARAMMAYMNAYQLIPLGRVQEVMGVLMGRNPPSQGTVVNTIATLTVRANLV